MSIFNSKFAAETSIPEKRKKIIFASCVFLTSFIFLLIALWYFINQKTSLTKPPYDQTESWRTNPITQVAGIIKEKKANAFVMVPIIDPLVNTGLQPILTINIDKATIIEKVLSSCWDGKGELKLTTEPGTFSDIISGAIIRVKTSADVRLNERITATHIFYTPPGTFETTKACE